VSTELERLAIVEQMLRDVRDDIHNLEAEMKRTRDRVHKLEGSTAGLVQVQRERNAQQDHAAKRVQLRLQLLTAVIALAALGEPFLYKWAGL
jgi:hypothetical protein